MDQFSSEGVRVRVNHSRTIKEGWGYETTVEVFLAGQPDPERVELLINRYLKIARRVGEEERERRRERDAESQG